MNHPYPDATPAAERRGPGWVYLVPLVFITAALLALVAVPVFLDRQVRSGEEYLDQALDPSLQLIAEIRYLQARQFAAVQGFVLTGDRSHREEYRRFDDRLLEAREELGESSRIAERSPWAPTDPPDDVAALLGALDQVTTLWTFNHLRVLTGEVGEEERGDDFIVNDRAAYEAADQAAADIERAVRGKMARATAELDEIRARQLPITAGLVGVSLLGTLAVGLIGRRMGGLVREVEVRRGDAVKARRQTEALMAATADGVVGIDLDGRITSMNEAGRHLLDYSAREVVGRNVHELIFHTSASGEPVPNSESVILRGLSTGEAVNLHETVVWARDGTPLPVQLQLRPLIDGRQVKGGVLTFTDIREQREIAEALRQALRARDEVLAVVSHDLRNPVGTVYSAADLLLEIELPREKLLEHLSIIKRSASHMNRLIQDLLDVARIEAGGFSVAPRLEEITPILEEACELSAPLAASKQIELHCRPADRLPAVKADRDRVLQVMSNLIGNALKFTPPEGRVEVSAEAGDREVVVTVSDTGPGIPPEDREQVFDRFWQVRRSDRAGAGLGLAIVRGIVESHGGRVWVDESPDGGSVFCFTLPTG